MPRDFVTRCRALRFNLTETDVGLQAAKLLNLKAVTFYDSESNTTKEGDVANWANELMMREVDMLRLAPVTQQMVLSLHWGICAGNAKVPRTTNAKFK